MGSPQTPALPAGLWANGEGRALGGAIGLNRPSANHDNGQNRDQ
jgi:hypothetical protein